MNFKLYLYFFLLNNISEEIYMLIKKFIILFISIMFFNLYSKDSITNDIVLITDPKVLAIEIKDCDENFIDIRSFNKGRALLYWSSSEIENKFGLLL